MSYQVLARKWRPRTFHELVGQEHVQRALVNALDQGRLHHAYLFTGTRGVGKTTLARILAKCLNCTAGGRGDEGVTSTPCGECDSCLAIDEGRFVDLIEVDAASRTKVEDTRELLDNVQYAPTQGRYKVYLIDEVHMLSTSSFNALLKTLEEPPPHVKFLLATTDPQKLPPTVLSRCLQFTLKHMPPERIVDHLGKVLAAESVPFEESALWLLGRAAEGSMRDAMSLTDQAIAFGQGRVEHADVAAMLGTLDQHHVLALIEALADVDAARLLTEVGNLAEHAPDFAGVLDEVTGVLHRLAIAQMVPEALDNAQGDREALLALASRFTAEDVQLYYQIGIQGRGDMASAPDLRTALEMTLLRMLAFRPQGVPRPATTPLPLRGNSEGAPPQGGDAPPAGSQEAGGKAEGATPSSTPSTPSTAPAPEAPRHPSPSNEPPAEPSAPPPPWVEAEPSPEPTPPAASEAPSPAEPAPAAPSPGAEGPSTVSRPAEPHSMEQEATPPGEAEPEPVSVPVAEEPDPAAVSNETNGHFSHSDWLACFETLGLGGLTRNLAAGCVVEEDDGERLRLRLDPTLSAMRAEIHIERMQQALAEHGVTRRLEVEEGEIPASVETPRQQAERLAAQRHARAVEALGSDPHVQQLQRAFGARLIESTVKPAGDLH
ncbi:MULTISPECIES: DNA polymerase III subunit gamma/tau [unclassified Halomonas]|uniref:DNA polymerase III subunit gamma/tau n=1 Tax=unclassified Halomonas TaxID=2609666 RepID=UPI00288895BC|nr:MULTISPECIES: DNA polymerase III subunit gamma/tau [unclassified Halomonas]MDT0502382.1 DNA polymerase III subunit gamma/tau [Halomonas sp. PAR7]MDT0510899.1 DNA polymerase III subunit gamma/tau [Halomonas sp. LES1]MDT0592777.1 DNA polymerase III subunit gamma/tau [Halomonas sp. PAR8]